MYRKNVLLLIYVCINFAFVFSNNNHQEAYELLLKKFSCTNLDECKRNDKNFNKESIKQEFATNPVLIQFRTAILNKDPNALRKLSYFLEDHRQQQIKLGFAYAVDALIEAASSVPLVVVTAIAMIGAAKGSENTVIGCAGLDLSLAGFMAKQFWNMYLSLYYSQKLHDVEYEIGRELRPD